MLADSHGFQSVVILYGTIRAKARSEVNWYDLCPEGQRYSCSAITCLMMALRNTPYNPRRGGTFIDQGNDRGHNEINFALGIGDRKVPEWVG